jgi:hypothetical protein
MGGLLLCSDIPLRKVLPPYIFRSLNLAVRGKIVSYCSDKNANGDESLLTINDALTPIGGVGEHDSFPENILPLIDSWRP